MKKLTYILLIALSLFVLNSCSKQVEGTDALNYVTFAQPSSYDFSVMPDTTMKYNINLYTTQITGSDRTIDITVDTFYTGDTLTPPDKSSYIVPKAVKVPANSNKGVLTLSLLDKNISVKGNTLVIGIAKKAGLYTGHPIQINIQEFCPMDNFPDGLVGKWTGTDAFYSANDVEIVVKAGDTLTVSGLSVGFMTKWWGENIVSGGSFSMIVNADGTVTIPRQYIYTTDYKSSVYEIKGAGKWHNCGATPTLSLIYDIYYKGDAKGLAATYSPKYLPTPYLSAELTLGSGPIVHIISNLPQIARHK